LNGQTNSWLNYDVISFNSFISSTGDVEGRLAVRNNANLGWGYSVGYETHEFSTDLTLQYALIVGGNLAFGSGAIYPDGTNRPHAGAQEFIFVGGSFSGPEYLGEDVTGNCSTPGCLDAAFDALQSCYGSYQSNMASNADNVVSLIQWSGLYLNCSNNPDAAIYYVTLTAPQVSSYTWIDTENCNPNARWVINIPGTDDVTFSGGSFPANAASVIYNVLGSGRNIYLQTQLVGSVVAPYNNYIDNYSVVIGKLIAGNVANSHQCNRAQCFVPQGITPSVPSK